MGGTNIFKVLADGQRREILMMLKDGRLNAGEISEKLQITPAALSYHLKLLKGVDLISEYKEKNFIYYEINTTVFDEYGLISLEGKNNEKNNVVFCINSSGCYKYCVTVYARHNTYAS